MNKAQECILARQYLEAALGVKTTQSYPKSSIDSNTSNIAVIADGKCFIATIAYDRDLILVNEPFRYDRLSEVQKRYPKPVVVMKDIYHIKTAVVISDYIGNGRFTARICGTNRFIDVLECEFEINNRGR